MTTGNPALIDIIRAEIEARGPQSFAWFMQQALYHPEHGYYSSGRSAIGRKGDYFTNVSIGPLFGRLLTAQFTEVWERFGKIDNFVVAEQGAHDGQFAHDVLEYAKKCAPEFFAALRYRIVEPFPIWQDRQRQTLESFGDKVDWRSSLEPFAGIHFSNELIDAMPVDLPGKLVDREGDRFVFVERPVREQSEPNQAALGWIDIVAANLQRGYVITIDYGHLGGALESTVQVRAQHRHLDSPFERIGQADITAHVDWASIADRARENGLRVDGFADQHHFLTGIISEWPELAAGADPKSKRELQTLFHPEMLGRSFQAIALSKNVDGDAPLAGFKFARPADL